MLSDVELQKNTLKPFNETSTRDSKFECLFITSLQNDRQSLYTNDRLRPCWTSCYSDVSSRNRVDAL